MAALYVPDGFGIGLLRWTVSGDAEEMAVTLGLQWIGPGSPDPTVMADALYDAATAAGSVIEAAAAFLAGWTFVGTEVRMMTAAGFATGSHDEPIVGLASEPALPNNCALLVRKITALGGRRNRGRAFVPLFDVNEDDIDAAGNVNPATLPGYQSRWDEFLEQLGVADLRPMLLHYPNDDDPTPDPTEITAFTVQPKIATQRRRMRP